MKPEDIFDGVTGIRDDLVDGAKKAAKPRKKRWYGAVAAVLVLALLGNLTLRLGGGPLATSAYAIAQAQYPEMAPFPTDYNDGSYHDDYNAWWESVQAQRRELGDTTSLEAFFARSSQTFLAGAEGENRVYSPLNVYMALSMLAELTDGNSRKQILTLLGSEDIVSLRQQAEDVWNANYRNDGATTCVMANSLWLNENVSFVKKTMDTLARSYYASSYRGKMGSDEFDQALRDWLNEQTGGLLKEYADQMELGPNTILALASTLYFKAAWSNEFLSVFTQPDTFHSPAGDVTCDFMRQGGSDLYYWGDSFSAISRSFQGSGEMWFLLPDEGVTPEELLTDEEAMDFLFGVTSHRTEWENQKHLFVHKAIPKFDVSSQIKLGKGLRELGITDVFDPMLSDFSPMTANSGGIFVSQADHAARVTIDEEGCEAAVFTVMANTGSGMPPEEEVDFVLDRPFLFCITGESGLPLFVGIVNHPGTA